MRLVVATEDAPRAVHREHAVGGAGEILAVRGAEGNAPGEQQVAGAEDPADALAQLRRPDLVVGIETRVLKRARHRGFRPDEQSRFVAKRRELAEPGEIPLLEPLLPRSEEAHV